MQRCQLNIAAIRSVLLKLMLTVVVLLQSAESTVDCGIDVSILKVMALNLHE